jgi:alpha-beta hydrolase superfamily lysophospholipase
LKHLSGRLTDAGDLFQQAWLPEQPATAALLLVHGFGEHSGRYAHVAAHFVAAGYAVYALDHDGHGNSPGTPGFVERFSRYTDGVAALLQHVREQQPGVPLFLVGHSLGGLISATFLLQHQQEFAGCVLSGPALASDAAPPAWLLAVNRVLAIMLPRLGMLKLDATAVSRDPEVVKRYLADPLVYKGKLTSRLINEMFKTMRVVTDGAPGVTLPMLIMHGEADTLVSPSGSEQLYELLGSTDKTLKIYPGLYHEIFNEPEQRQVLDDMLAWLEAHRTRTP